RDHGADPSRLGRTRTRPSPCRSAGSRRRADLHGARADRTRQLHRGVLPLGVGAAAPAGPVDDRSNAVTRSFFPSRLLIGAVLTALVTLCGCSFDPSDHALPGSGVRGPTYRLNLEFE